MAEMPVLSSMTGNNHIKHIFDRIKSTGHEDLFYTGVFQENETMGEVYVTFSNKPTAESKFLYTYDMLKKHKLLPIFCSSSIPKCNSEAAKLRARGTEKFRKKDYVSALCDYNKCVMTAIPDPDDKEYVFGLANRSAALYHLNEFEACFIDIRHIMTHCTYPNEMVYKLCEREIKCLVELGRISEAKSKLEDFSCHLSRAHLSSEQKNDVKTKLTNFFNEFANQYKNKDEDKKTKIELSRGQNKNIPALSKNVKVKYSESMGRCLVASTDIYPGDILAIEKPYAGVLRKESFEFNCRNCFKRCLNGIPCLNCTLVIYCDDTCRTKSNESGHKYECSIFRAFDSWPSMKHMEHLSLYIFLTTVMKSGLDKYVDTVRALNADTTDSIMRGFNSYGKYLSDQFCSTYTLEGNENKRTISDLFLRNCYAATMVSFIQLSGLKIPDHQLGTVGESLVHLICVVSSNAHEITQHPLHKTHELAEQDQCRPVASLLMPVLSLLNHHCDPNVVRHNYNGIIVVRAIQPILKDSQLFDNYGLLYATHEKETRQQKLFSQYRFHCECKPCEENWPVYNVLSNQLQSECVMLSEMDSKLIEELSNKLNGIIKDLKTGNHNGLEHIKFLYFCLATFHKHVKKPCKEYCNCQETIKEVLYKTTDKFIIEVD